MKTTSLKISAIIAFIIMCSFSIVAQVKSTPGAINKVETANRNVSDLNQELNLDEKQIETLTKLYITFYENLEKARKDFDKKPHKTQMKMLDKIKALNQEKENKVISLLTPYQLELYYKIQEKIKRVKKTPLNGAPTQKDSTKTPVVK